MVEPYQFLFPQHEIDSLFILSSREKILLHEEFFVLLSLLQNVSLF